MRKEKYYLHLQYQFLRRSMIDFGLRPILGYILCLMLFLAGSIFLFNKTELAVYIYLTLGLSVITRFLQTDRSYFLKSIFTLHDYYKIRTFENVICLLPFNLFLVFNKKILPATILLVLGILLTRMRAVISSGRSIPTPFFQRPYEFIVGFRSSYPVLILAYLLAIIGIKVDNYNLAVFSIALIFFVCMSYNMMMEKEYYIFIHAMTPPLFLWSKIKTALIYSTLLVIPAMILIGIFYPNRLLPIVLIWLIGILFLTAGILGKYSSYPRDMNVPNGFLLGMSILFPPLLLILIPHFYKLSTHHLRQVL